MSTAPTPIPASSAPAVRWLADHGDTLYLYAIRRVRDPHAAEDLVQETLLAAMMSADGFAGRSAEGTWLVGILKHKLIDHLRKSIRQQPMTELEAADSFDPFDRSGHWKLRISTWRCDPQQALENVEFRKVIASCLSKLPPRIAQVFWLYEAESMNSKELCKELEISPTNVWTMLHRAHVRFSSA